MQNAEDKVDIDAALGTLINLSGKMRMLSHRTALFAMLISSKGEGAAAQLQSFDDAAREFQAIFEAVTQGSDALGIPAQAAAVLVDDGAVGTAITGPIERFLALVSSLRPSLASGAGSAERTMQLVDLVAGELLGALNSLTAAVSARLKQRMGSRQAQTEQVRSAMLQAVGSISDVSMKVKLISINASIEAARAGPYGKSFGVIAAEIRTLSEDAARSAQGLRDQMERSA